MRNRNYGDLYPEGRGFEWEWDSSSNRKKFDKIRIKSGIANKYATFALGGLVAHRIISIIDVLYLKAKKENFEMNSGFSSTHSGELQYSVTFNF